MAGTATTGNSEGTGKDPTGGDGAIDWGQVLSGALNAYGQVQAQINATNDANARRELEAQRDRLQQQIDLARARAGTAAPAPPSSGGFLEGTYDLPLLGPTSKKAVWGAAALAGVAELRSHAISKLFGGTKRRKGRK